MVLICGIPSEAPLAMVRKALDELSVPYVLFNQRDFARMHLSFEIGSGQVTGLLKVDAQTYRLEDFGGIYTRVMDDRLLPELRGQPADSPMQRYCRSLHDSLMHWCEVTPARVVNRTGPMGSNSSKPYQAQLILAHGFAVPDTLITNDPDLVLEFRRQHPRVIYKSISGVRSIVKTLEDEDLARLDRIRWCPTQFQGFVEGVNVRVHTVDTEVFASAVTTDATDYRYAYQQGGSSSLDAMELPEELAARCVKLARALELPFAGIDLKMAPDGQVFCFEVNPSPGFSYYQNHTGQPIAQAVARYLAGRGAGT